MLGAAALLRVGVIGVPQWVAWLRFVTGCGGQEGSNARCPDSRTPTRNPTRGKGAFVAQSTKKVEHLSLLWAAATWYYSIRVHVAAAAV